MHLQDHLGRKALGAQALGDTHHGDLDDIGSRPLHGMVHRRALAEHALRGDAQLRDRAASAIHGLGIARLLGESHGLVQIRAHTGVRTEIRVDHLTRLGHGDIERLGQAVCLLAVHDAEVHRLGSTAQLWGDLVHGDAENARRRLGVEVLALVEGAHQVFVSGEVRQ